MNSPPAVCEGCDCGWHRCRRNTETNREGQKIRRSFSLGARIFQRLPNVFKGAGSQWRWLMKRTLVRYRTKPEQAEENERLIGKVFQELQAKSPDGVRYLALKLDDGTFVHFVESTDGSSPLTALEAFRSFLSGIKERCIDPPRAGDATIVGNYRMVGEL
jgi:hypothetical protein